MGKALVIRFANGNTRTFPVESYCDTSNAGVLRVMEKYSKPEWWVMFNLRFVMSWGPEEVEL